VAFAAVTVKVDTFPEIIEVGFAVMLTVGMGFGVTVTVTFAEVLPPTPVAAAVYVAVVAGLTSCSPPLGCKVYELPSVPVTVT
jgi:predicted tellurium resistance membrane protein TerC